MKTLYELGLSQEYVAKTVGLGRPAITQIELGNRKISSEELARFCNLYHLSADYLLDTQPVDNNQAVFARNFDELTESDQQEIINLIAFKKAMNQKPGGVDAFGKNN